MLRFLRTLLTSARTAAPRCTRCKALELVLKAERDAHTRGLVRRVDALVSLRAQVEELRAGNEVDKKRLETLLADLASLRTRLEAAGIKSDAVVN